MEFPSTGLPECWASKTAQPKSSSDSTAGKATSSNAVPKLEEKKKFKRKPLHLPQDNLKVNLK